MSLPEGYSYTVARGLYNCHACGCVVHNTDAHDSWHKGLRDFIMNAYPPYGQLKGTS